MGALLSKLLPMAPHLLFALRDVRHSLPSAPMPNPWSREQEAAARDREKILEDTVTAREQDLKQAQAKLARQQQQIKSFSQRIYQLESTAANMQAELQAKEQKAAKMLQESKKELENERLYIKALKENGFVSRPEGWERMTKQQRDELKNKLRDQAHQKLGINTKNFNFAITGASGTGKSSLINAVREISDTHPDACKIGVIETTSEIKCYPLPEHPHIVLWDIPGAGTENHPENTYFLDKCLYAFDCLIIVTAGRFTELEARLGQTCREFETPVVFVRNKSDQSLNEIKRQMEGAKDFAAELRKQVEASVRPVLTKYGLADAMLFIVSAWAFLDDQYHRMDEVKLAQYTLDCAIKRRLDA